MTRVAHLHPLTNVPTKYQHPTGYSLRTLRYSPDKVFPAASLPIWKPWVKTIPDNPEGLWVKTISSCEKLWFMYPM